MGGAKKRWIDPKKATTFSLVYRSTEVGEEDAAPQRELVEADGGGRGRVDVEVAAAAHAVAGATQRRYPPGHPLAWLEAEAWEAAADMSEARRREQIELGFPDDGYDYIKHMRTLGRGAASLEGLPPPTSAAVAADTAAGTASVPLATFSLPVTSVPADAPTAVSAVFVSATEAAPPEEDMRIVDASTLRVLQAAERDEEAAGLMGGVTAFSRVRDRVHGVGECC